MMTEKEWLTTPNPFRLWQYVTPLRCKGCGIRRSRTQGDGAIEIMPGQGRYVCSCRGEDAAQELVPDHLVTDRQLRLLAAACYAARYGVALPADAEWAAFAAGEQGGFPTSPLREAGAWCAAENYDGKVPLFADRLRDIAGNPFRPVLTAYGLGLLVEEGRMPTNYAVFDTAWLTERVTNCAHRAYDTRDSAGLLDPDTLGVLADALEEAGCPAHEVVSGAAVPHRLLAHLRARHQFVVSCTLGGATVQEGRYDSREEAERKFLALMGEHQGASPAVRIDEAGCAHVRGCWALELALLRSPAKGGAA